MSTSVLKFPSAAGIKDKVAALDWPKITASLDANGCAVAESVLTPGECRALAGMYSEDGLFRSRIVMARHGFGRGEYKYWAYPLPATVASLRSAIYPHLADVANRWNAAMNIGVTYPADHKEYLEQCHRAGQTKPTPLLLQYQEGDFNIKTCTERGSSRYKLRSCFPRQPRISRAASLS
jgi:hypothetical protein